MKLIKKILIGVLLNGIALYVVVNFLDNISYTGGWKFFLIGGLIMGILNTFIKPLIKLFSLPLIFISLGLILFLINGVLIFLLEKILIQLAFEGVSFHVDGFLVYIIAGLVFGFINFIEHLFIKN
ncbi:hypothetical protein A2483_03715 [Candidatus Peregrinibacteria bacterium RIFOXYC2_FULL_33_13]|nr:MAG: hypothetical protein UR27_C0001G0047 [Candidatus Peregrinibacteria bacterium GW2011_GWA2_33_10]OGJ50361.1 MAG: hypothetical protein A2229_04405 [Candidatus Peregrinibacteria bacterium RIFOXYA2_FULL_33_7]OGJ53015.1 MAG: hypothetical protein A2483_03715 [Candidatus Peregrinibacteria bacterium RIFOXYC2_FULL_33_13]